MPPIHFTWEITLGQILQMVGTIIGLGFVIARYAAQFLKRFAVVELKINILWTKQASDEEKAVVKEFMKRMGFGSEA